MSTSDTTPGAVEGREREFVVPKDAPQFDPGFVRRPRLTRRLLGSGGTRLVQLTAPAGYSKTSCLAEWGELDPRQFTWISADSRHVDPALLVASIAEALAEVGPIDPNVFASLATPKPAISEVVLPRLGRSLQARRQPFVLVVDDFHLLTNPEAVEVVSTLLQHLPEGAQLAVSSRTEPNLATGRLRAHRGVVELTRRDLAMDRDEGKQLLSDLGLHLTSEQFDVVYGRTEGWPAALYLAGLALADQPDMSAAVASFAGDDRVVVDYLRDEFLSAMSESMLTFLTRSSILDELSGPVCDAVLERSDSAQALRDLSRSNSLVVPLDRRDERYRYHHLFAEMLASELRRREPQIEADLHARASASYDANSDPDRAIDHAISSGNVERAGELIWEAFPEFAGKGRIATIERWLDELGADQIRKSVTLLLASTHRDLALGRGDRAAESARIAGGLLRSSVGPSESAEADLRLVKATLATEGVIAMGEDATRASELFGPEAPWLVPCFLYRGVSKHLTGNPDAARPLLQEAARRGALVISVIQVLSLSQLSLIAVEQGDWETGSRLIAQAREQVERCGLIDYPSISLVFAVSSLVRAHQGQVEKAQKDIADAQRLLPRLIDFPPWYEAESRIVLARACARLDKPADARDLLRDAASFLGLAPDASVLVEWWERSLNGLESAHDPGRNIDRSLTKAELRTLQYLPTHLSFREIAERIHVSPNTIKTQAQAVYRKLDATSRSEAVENARQVGLLDHEGTPMEHLKKIIQNG